MCIAIEGFCFYWLSCLPNSTPKFGFFFAKGLYLWALRVQHWSSNKLPFFLALSGSTFVRLWSNWTPGSGHFSLFSVNLRVFEAMLRCGLGPIIAFCASVVSQSLKSWNRENGGTCEVDLRHSTVNYIPDPRRFFIWLLQRWKISISTMGTGPCSD